LGAQGEGRGILRGIPAPNQRSAMDDEEGQIDEMGASREAHYALECREYIRATTAHKIRHLGE
jgi:hypothetical protein